MPITWAATCITISAITGLTFPGMIDDPGCSDGSRISVMPVRGPLASQRRSLAILNSDTATVLRVPEALTAASLAAWASKWLSASRSGYPVMRAMSAMTAAAKPSGALRPVPTAVPPNASSSSSGSTFRRRSTPLPTWVA